MDHPPRRRQRDPARDVPGADRAAAASSSLDVPASDTALSERFRYRGAARNVRALADPDLGRIRARLPWFPLNAPEYEIAPAAGRVDRGGPHERACGIRGRALAGRRAAFPPASVRRVLGDHGARMPSSRRTAKGEPVNGTAVLYHRFDPYATGPVPRPPRRHRSARPRLRSRRPPARRAGGRSRSTAASAAPTGRRRAPARAGAPVPAAGRRPRRRGRAPARRGPPPPPPPSAAPAVHRRARAAPRRPGRPRRLAPARPPPRARNAATPRPLTSHHEKASTTCSDRSSSSASADPAARRCAASSTSSSSSSSRSAGSRGIPAAWQFLHFDTPTARTAWTTPSRSCRPQEYRGLVSTGATYNTVYGSIESAHATNAAVHQDIQRQLPDPRSVKVDVTKGAGQYRAVGRAVALAATKDIATAARARDRPARRRLGARRAADPRPGAARPRRRRRRQPDGDRDLVGRRRLGSGPVPRHHRGRRSRPRSRTRGRTSSSASSTPPTSSISSMSPRACRATRSPRSPRR